MFQFNINFWYSGSVSSSSIHKRVERAPQPRARSSPDKDSGLLIENIRDEPIEPLRTTNLNKTTSVGFLPLPPNYNKLVIPLGNVTKSIFVMVQLAIREILDVDTKNEVWCCVREIHL